MSKNVNGTRRSFDQQGLKRPDAPKALKTGTGNWVVLIHRTRGGKKRRYVWRSDLPWNTAQSFAANAVRAGYADVRIVHKENLEMGTLKIKRSRRS